MSYLNKKILIVGLGISGRSAAYFSLKNGGDVFGIDQNLDNLEQHPEMLSLKLQGLKATKQIYDLKGFDLIVISPGIPPTHPIYELINKYKTPIIGEIELGCRSVKHPILGITGTNGKTTVTLLVTHILNHAKKKACALGNIGIPFTKQLDKLSPNEIIVLELSSYELETLSTPAINAGVILNITPDHLDRYTDMDSYAKAKLHLQQCIKSSGNFFISEQVFDQFSFLLKNQNVKTFGYSPNSFIYSDLEYIFLNNNKQFKLPKAYIGFKSHDLENIMAAYALCNEVGIHSSDFLSGLQTFKKPSHRIEFVLEKNGIFYYDDSKGTNIDAVTCAVRSLKGPIILIAGGVDKGASYTTWIEEFKNKVKCICAIGQAACKIEEELSRYFPIEIFKDLEQAVLKAKSIAEPGDYVLLSPGCSSFDMFRDYVHRGEEFKRLVRQL